MEISVGTNQWVHSNNKEKKQQCYMKKLKNFAKKKIGLGEKGKIPDNDEAKCRTGKLDHKHKQGCGDWYPSHQETEQYSRAGFTSHAHMGEKERFCAHVHSNRHSGTIHNEASQKDIFSVSNLKNVPY